MSGMVMAALVLTACWLPACQDEDPAAAPPREVILIADFEGEDYGDWTVEGEAFGPGPARGTLPHQMVVTGYLGEGLVNSFYSGDDSVGQLTSPPFTIARTHINFLLGGGQHPGRACIELIVDGEVVRSATGPNDRPGGSEHLDWHGWAVADLQGRDAVLRIVDRQQGGWGHINVDHLVQEDHPRRSEPAFRDIEIEQRYLHFPVRTGATKRRIRILDGETTLREFEIELADQEPDFHVFGDLAPFTGKTLRLAIDRSSSGAKALDGIIQADEVPGAERMYREEHRPQFHFTTRRGWVNDPNGLVYHDGEYHLFYQHNPYGWNWGNMHWGHAVSPDLVHWRELPLALYPHRYGDWCFSGSALIDHENVAGFQTGDEKVLVAFYTSTGRGESIAFSNDRGRTFTDFEGNPVVRHRGRDPKVIRYEPGGHWVMAVYDEEADSRGIAIYTSTDLKEWTRRSRIDGYYECPELFELFVDGDPAKMKWVVYGADGAYSIGSFDGATFTPEVEKQRFQYGNCFYASQTFNGIPEDDGRRIQIAWGRVALHGMPFNQMMDFPVELTLRTTERGLRMCAEPVAELAALHERSFSRNDLEITSEPVSLRFQGGESPGELLHLQLRWSVGEAEELGLNILGITLLYRVGAAELECAGNVGSLPAREGMLELEILVDRTSIEIFGGGGLLYMPIGTIVSKQSSGLLASSRGGPSRIEQVTVHELRTAWSPR